MNRDNRFDYYKGLLIIGVIWGHVITALKCGENVYPWIHLFVRTYDMPMFAFISGFFLKRSLEKYPAWENLLNKVGGILVPTLLWNIIYNLSVGESPFHFGGYWFLWSLFWCSCIVILVDFLLRKNSVWKSFVFVLILTLCHMGWGERWRIGFLLFPCVVGYYYAKREAKRDFCVNTLLIILFVVLQCFWSLKYNVWNAGVNIFAHGTPLRTAGKIFFRTVLGITGCFVMKMCFDVIFDLMAQSSYPQMHTIQSWIVTAGQNTLGIYILQRFFVETWGASLVRKIVGALGWNPFVINTGFLGYCLAPAITVLSVMILIWVKKRICAIPCIGTALFGVRIMAGSVFSKNK